MTEQVKNIIVDGTEYPVAKFSDKVQNLLALRQRWSDEAENQRNDLIKTEAALRQLDSELTTSVTAELAPPEVKEEVAAQ